MRRELTRVGASLAVASVLILLMANTALAHGTFVAAGDSDTGGRLYSYLTNAYYANDIGYHADAYSYWESQNPSCEYISYIRLNWEDKHTFGWDTHATKSASGTICYGGGDLHTGNLSFFVGSCRYYKFYSKHQTDHSGYDSLEGAQFRGGCPGI